MNIAAFFYGTLMTGFDRRRRAGIEGKLRNRRRGWTRAGLFDLGIYPAAIPDPDGCVWGEVYDMDDPPGVLAALDEIEGCREGHPDQSLYTRHLYPVTLDTGDTLHAWVYFYNAPLGGAQRIDSGDYLQHVRMR
ncbi:MAG: gamma-glutamylcyclotransferase [Acidobacteria bacterium]|nr:gamma-glutamylcyclotransferase [Acidobacteriota bacterium]